MILIRRFVCETIGEGENPREARKKFLVLPPPPRWFEPVGGKGETYRLSPTVLDQWGKSGKPAIHFSFM